MSEGKLDIQEMAEKVAHALQADTEIVMNDGRRAKATGYGNAANSGRVIRWLLIIGAFVLLACAAVACADNGYNTSPPSFSSPLQGTADAIALNGYATSAAVEVNAKQANANATAQAAVYGATAQAAQAQADQQRLIATQQAGHVTAQAQATADTFRMQATQQAAHATRCAQETALAQSVAATSQALAIQATAQAEAMRVTQTAQAINRQATAQAEARNVAATATAQHGADVATATRQAWEGRVTSTAEVMQATAAAYQATATRAAAEREIVLGYGRDYGIPLALLVVAGGVGALIVYAIRQQAKRPVVYPRNFLGDAEPMAIPVQGGGYTLVDLDRQPGPALTVLPSGQVAAPLLRSAAQEERTTARDQAVDATTRPKLGGSRRETPALPAPPEAPAPGLRSVRVLRRLDQAGKAGFLPPPLVESLQADWEEV